MLTSVLPLEIDGCSPTSLRPVVSTWTLCGGRLAPRRAHERYTAEPAACARLVYQAYHRRPGRTTRRPPGLDSLTPDAHRAGLSTPDHHDSLLPNASTAA